MLTSSDEAIVPRDMKLLIDAIQELSLARDLETLMRIVRTVARKLTGADGATFVLRDRGMCYYADEDAIAPLWKGQRFPMSVCISGWAMMHGQPAVIGDIYTDDRIPLDAYRPTFVKSLVMVPVRRIDPIAAIGNYWASKHDPTDEEVAILQSLADSTAVAMENINIYNELEYRINERTRELLESLERERKMNEAKTGLVSLASHEFKTPLTAILTSAVILEKTDPRSDPNKARHIKKIKSSVNNLNELLNDFLTIDKLEQGMAMTHFEELTLTELVSEVTGVIEDILKRGQTIRHRHSGRATVFQDYKILRNILLNLLSNASKYSAEDQPIELDTCVQGSGLTIKVTDHGIGIPQEEQDRIFSHFFRASNASRTPGTGLGLNIVKRYMDLLNGNIHFSSHPGQGTSFILEFQATD